MDGPSFGGPVRSTSDYMCQGGLHLGAQSGREKGIKGPACDSVQNKLKFRLDLNESVHCLELCKA